MSGGTFFYLFLFIFPLRAILSLGEFQCFSCFVVYCSTTFNVLVGCVMPLDSMSLIQVILLFDDVFVLF